MCPFGMDGSSYIHDLHCSLRHTLLKMVTWTTNIPCVCYMQKELFQRNKRRGKYFTKQARGKNSNHAVVNKQKKNLAHVLLLLFLYILSKWNKGQKLKKKCRKLQFTQEKWTIQQRIIYWYLWAKRFVRIISTLGVK